MNKNEAWRNTGLFFLFGGPTLFAFTVVFVIPFLVGLYLTFTKWDVIKGDGSFVGLVNYVEVFRDKVFLTQLWFTIKYVIFTVIISNLLAFFIALALTGGMKGERWLRTGYFTPNLIGGIVLGYLWQSLFSRVLPY